MCSCGPPELLVDPASGQRLGPIVPAASGILFNTISLYESAGGRQKYGRSKRRRDTDTGTHVHTQAQLTTQSAR